MSEDIVGKRFGRLVVLSKDKKLSNGSWRFICQCDCGNTTRTKKGRLVGGETKSCGCIRFTLQEAVALNNLQGKTFGRLTVLEKLGADKAGRVRWKCLCDCGAISSPRGADLYAGRVSSCGCGARAKSVALRKIDLTGKVFGRLKVLNECERRDSGGNVYWHCLCECGVEKEVAGRSLRNGDIVSCGCFHKDIAGKAQQDDLSGMAFGRLTVIRRDYVDKKQGSFWLCQCQCGNTTTVRQNSIMRFDTRSCGCLNLETEKRRKDLTGENFGRLKVLRYDGSIRSGQKGSLDATWLCICQCGNEKVIRGRSLRDGSTLSCGCYIRELSTTHGLSQTKEYRRAEARRRKISKTERTPSWANNDKILQIYKNKPPGTHVDHIIPLHCDLVCGLHVENNLQYLSVVENLTKSNKFDIDTYVHAE